MRKLLFALAVFYCVNGWAQQDFTFDDVDFSDGPQQVEEFDVKAYVGSSQFFDITGIWVNEEEEASRIQRLDIIPSIIKTYRLRPYYAMMGQVFPGDVVPLTISDKDLAYKATLSETKSLIMPIDVFGQEKLIMYSLIGDPSGALTGMVKETFVRKEEKGNTPIRPSFDLSEMEGYWKNEWEENKIISRFQIYREKGKYFVTPYRFTGGKHRLIGVFPTEKKVQNNGTMYLEYTPVAGVTANMYLRPIMVDYVLKGIDMLVEEVAANGAPKKIYRQFFVHDPDAEIIEKTDRLIVSLEDEWVNLDPNGATSKIRIYDGDVEIWVNCKKNDGNCLLGRKLLKGKEVFDEKMVAAEFPSMSQTRYIDFDIALDVNEAHEKPQLMVVNTFIKDREGTRPDRKYTEVFKRKGVDLKNLNVGINRP